MWSASLVRQNLGKSGNHGSGIEESFFKQMRGQFSDTILAIFRNAYGKRSGTVGGEGTTNLCAFTWRVKMHSDISFRSCATGLFLPLLKAKETV